MRNQRRAGRAITAGAVAVLLALAAWVAAGCTWPQGQPTVKIGLIAPLAGQAADEGYRWVFAAKQALREWNAAGHPVYAELVAHDESDGPAAARRLAADPAVVAVVGHWRPEVAAQSASVYQQAGLTVLSLVYGGCDSRPGSAMLCVAPGRDALADATATFARGRAAQAAVALVAGPDLADLALAEALRAGAMRAGLRVVRTEAALPYAIEFSDMAPRLAAENPDVVVFSGSLAAALSFARDVPAMRAARVYALHRGGAPTQRLAPDFGLAPFGQPATAAFAAFRGAYQQAWGEAPSPEAAAVYDATRLVLRAVAAGRQGRQGVGDALRGGEPFTGVLGVYRPGDGRLDLSAAPAVVPLGE